MVYCTSRIFAKIRGIMGLCTFFPKESQTRKFTFYSGEKFNERIFARCQK